MRQVEPLAPSVSTRGKAQVLAAAALHPPPRLPDPPFAWMGQPDLPSANRGETLDTALGGLIATCGFDHVRQPQPLRVSANQNTDQHRMKLALSFGKSSLSPMIGYHTAKHLREKPLVSRFGI